ncbi:MAG: hypothetical protein ABSD78_12655 [Acidimicrobiales bacterium]
MIQRVPNAPIWMPHQHSDPGSIVPGKEGIYCAKDTGTMPATDTASQPARIS